MTLDERREIGTQLLETIHHRRLPDVVAERILEAARSGSIREGDRLPSEPELAKQLGVGRTTIREALGKLQALGLVEVIRGRGSFLRTSGEHDDAKTIFARWTRERRFEITHLVEVRISLESVAAGLAANRATAREIVQLKRLNDRHRAAATDNDHEGVVETDAAFHVALIDASDNPFLGRLYAALADELVDFRRKTLALEGAPERSASGHDTIIGALERRDATGARAAAVSHLWVLYKEIDAASRPTARGAHHRIAPRSAFDAETDGGSGN